MLILVSSLEAYIYMPRCNEAAAAWRFFAGVMAVHAAVTAAVWYRASVCRRTGRMPAVLMLLLLLLQLGCGASTLRKLGLQQACSMPSFWPTILQITLPEVVTCKLACAWLEQSGSPGLQAWHSTCARCCCHPDPSLPAPCIVCALLYPCPAVLAYVITVTTGVWQVPPGGQGPWWRPLLPSVVHAATLAAAAIRVTAAWPVIAFLATMGLILGSDAWTMAWPTVRERMPGSIATWGDQHVANGLLAGRAA